MNERSETKNPFTNGRIIKTDCTIKEYLASKGGEDGAPRILSRTDLCQIALCPSRWRAGYREEDRATPSKDFGSLFDCLLLQPAKLESYYMMAPKTYDTKKGETKDWTWRSSTCRDWRTEQEEKGFLVTAEEDLVEAKSAVETLLAHPLHGEQMKRLIGTSTHQVFSIAEYADPETGIKVPVKVLTDIVPDKGDPEFGQSLFDLKTARSAHPRAWKKAVHESDYHVQAALNLDIYTAATGEDRLDFRHLIVENFAPWETARRCLSQEFLELGRFRVGWALRTYCQALASGVWPSYSDPGALILRDGFEICSPEPWMVGQ